MILTVLEAGFALKKQGSLVKGLMPFRAGVAGFFLSFRFKQPPSLKAPFFLSSAAAKSMKAAITALASLGFTPQPSATLEAAADAVKAVIAAFMDLAAAELKKNG